MPRSISTGDIEILPQYSLMRAKITTMKVGPTRTSGSVRHTASAVTHDTLEEISPSKVSDKSMFYSKWSALSRILFRICWTLRSRTGRSSVEPYSLPSTIERRPFRCLAYWSTSFVSCMSMTSSRRETYSFLSDRDSDGDKLRKACE